MTKSKQITSFIEAKQIPFSCTRCGGTLLPKKNILSCPSCQEKFSFLNEIPIFGNSEEIQEWTKYHTELGLTGKVASGAYLGEEPAPNNSYYSQFIPHDAKYVLDAGGGDGNASADWAEHHQNSTVHVMDLSLHGLKKVQRRNLPNLVPVCAGTDTQFPYLTDQFDAISTVFMVEHMSPIALKRFFAEAYRTLKPGGVLIVASDSPFYDRVLHPLERLFRQGRYVSNDPTHINLMTPSTCSKYIEKQGFSQISKRIHWVAGRHSIFRNFYKLLPTRFVESTFSTMYVIMAKKL